MSKSLSLTVFAAGAALTMAPIAHADRAEPPPLYGYYNVFIDFSKQTFNGRPTPMTPITVPVELTTQCDVNGCVARWNNEDDHARNSGAPPVYEYRWTGDRWTTSGAYPYFCDHNDPAAASRPPARIT
nr:hypothetical protein CPGR_04789 [Mycolicibacterium malmesburyense]